MQCKGYFDTVAQGVNRVDCIYEDDSSYHCDNNNFGDISSGCYQKAYQINSPVNSGLVSCKCSGGWSGGGGGGGRGGGGGFCSIAGKLAIKSSNSCTCEFKSLKDYEHLGQFLHPIQDFWSHSTALYVYGCEYSQCYETLVCSDLNVGQQVIDKGWPERFIRSNTVNNSTLLLSASFRLPDHKGTNYKICTRNCEYLCTSYRIHRIWTESSILTRSVAALYEIKSGLFDSGGWKWYDDFFCSNPPCEAHCMLNKDDPGNVNRKCTNPCPPPHSECTDDKSIQRAAHTEAKQRAIESTKFYLRSFCLNAPNLCY